MSDNYFKIFDLPTKFDVDLELLNERYFKLQKISHPDMIEGDVVDSARLNLAYKTLNSRFKRAEYIIELHGDSEFQASPELLMEMMELREGDAEEKLPQVKQEIEDLFIDFAHNQTAEIFVRIKYLNRFLEERK
jgi:molecular chaperone HscB